MVLVQVSPKEIQLVVRQDSFGGGGGQTEAHVPVLLTSGGNAGAAFSSALGSLTMALAVLRTCEVKN